MQFSRFSHSRFRQSINIIIMTIINVVVNACTFIILHCYIKCIHTSQEVSSGNFPLSTIPISSYLHIHNYTPAVYIHQFYPLHDCRLKICNNITITGKNLNIFSSKLITNYYSLYSNLLKLLTFNRKKLLAFSYYINKEKIHY